MRMQTVRTLSFSKHCLACVGCAMLIAASGCFQSVDGLTKYPVKGTITVDGQPAADVVIRLTAKDKSPTLGNARFPFGVTDDDGAFKISTSEDGDGAAAGEYDVVIIWPENSSPPLSDRLGGAYSTPEESKLSITVEPGENVLPTFELKRPAVRPQPPPERSEDE